ncbi:hypothetical protein AB07_3923 [Citrobacter freundii]|nr:hypothetical protein AB07_3923 [Citrobacter freundii]
MSEWVIYVITVTPFHDVMKSACGYFYLLTKMYGVHGT